MGNVLLVTDERFLDHATPQGHPERPARIGAVLDALDQSPIADALVRQAPRRAELSDILRVHDQGHIGALAQFCRTGGGAIDPDTHVVPASWDAALLAAGAGLTAIEALSGGEADAAFCAVRPPGHHASAHRAMGFCLLNSVAVSAAALADAGERVLIVDWDAHHGNGTQDVFYDDDRVLFISMHQYPFWPYTGAITDTGRGPGAGYTINVPFPAGTPGDAYRQAIDEVVTPAACRFAPTWVLISAGFDAHRADPLTEMGLSSGDYVELTQRVVDLVAPGRRIAFLEGGYNLAALGASAAACVGALSGEVVRPEPLTNGDSHRSVSDEIIEQVRIIHAL